MSCAWCYTTSWFGATLFPNADFGFVGGSGGSLGPVYLDWSKCTANDSNPDMMREIMNKPAMQSLMNNHELMRTMIMNHPQTRELIDRNQELAHILNDTNIIRPTLETVRNPELMREMMRNTERAMRNIESSPEGFNMLRRVYENVQESFLYATVGGAGNYTFSNPFASLLGNQGRGEVHVGTNITQSESVGAVPNSNPFPNSWGRFILS